MNEEAGYCHFLVNIHMDAAWLWPMDETVNVCRDTFGRIPKLMDEYPNFCHCQSSPRARQAKIKLCIKIANGFEAELFDKALWKRVSINSIMPFLRIKEDGKKPILARLP